MVAGQDRIATPDGQGANVICLVEMEIAGGKGKEMCQVGERGLKITPGHPIFYEGAWIYPRDKFPRSLHPCTSIYNLVVDRNHIAIINGVQAILLGHSYTEGILKH